jgi:hypothetical protein
VAHPAVVRPAARPAPGQLLPVAIRVAQAVPLAAVLLVLAVRHVVPEGRQPAAS